jgi:hypothetical protein
MAVPVPPPIAQTLDFGKRTMACIRVLQPLRNWPGAGRAIC